MKSAPHLDGDGFSLLEVLIVLAISGLIATAASGMVTFWNRIDERSARIERHLSGFLDAQRTFRSLVSSALPTPLRAGDAFSRAGVEGRSDRLRLAAFGPVSLRLDRPSPLALIVRESAGAKNIVLEWNDPQSGDLRSETVLAGVRAARFRYIDRRPDGSIASSENWGEAGRLPTAIALAVEDDVPGPPLEIIVRTEGRLPAACVLLPADPARQAGGS